MTAAAGEQTKFGGEYGEIRSELDVRSLNRWLDSNSQARERVKAPVVVKQFVVSPLVKGISLYLSYAASAWTGKAVHLVARIS
jgi:hypothetical protein